MKIKTICRLLKAISFILGIIGYGILNKLSENDLNIFLASMVFAFILSMYLIELYKGGNQDGR